METGQDLLKAIAHISGVKLLENIAHNAFLRTDTRYWVVNPHILLSVYIAVPANSPYTLLAQAVERSTQPDYPDPMAVLAESDVVQSLIKINESIRRDLIKQYSEIDSNRENKGQVYESLNNFQQELIKHFAASLDQSLQEALERGWSVSMVSSALGSLVTTFEDNTQALTSLHDQYSLQVQETNTKLEKSFHVARNAVEKRRGIWGKPGKQEVGAWLVAAHSHHDAFLGFRVTQHMIGTFHEFRYVSHERLHRLSGIPETFPNKLVQDVLAGNLPVEQVQNIICSVQERSEEMQTRDIIDLPILPRIDLPDFDAMSPEQTMQWLESLANRQGASVPCSQAQFSAYFPPEVHVKQRYSVLVYAYTSQHEDDIKRDADKDRDKLGTLTPKFKVAKQIAEVEIGTAITVVPECEEIEFEPVSLTKKWHGDWTKFEFEFRPSENLADETIFVRVSIQIAGIEIAQIKCAIEVISSQESKPTQEVVESNPLAAAKLKSQTVTTYQRIFISYSRQDSNVAKSYKIALTALGNEAFLDVDNLRAGENWRAALARAIDDADIFQLFWSEHSATSEYCRYEWDYALKSRCPDKNCEGFIRPVYWRKPMPSPPDDLSVFNFRYVPFEDQAD